MLTIVDDFSKEAIDLVADFGNSGHYVTRVMDQAARFRCYPKAIRTDQGPEFTGRALDQWAYKHGVQLKLIQWENRPRMPSSKASMDASGTSV